MKRLLLLLLVSIFLQAKTSFAQEQSVLIFLRHAEKDSIGTDPTLTKRGIERTKGIATLLQEQKIEAVFTTPFNRTRETGKIIAESQNASLIEYNPFKTEIIENWKAEYKGKTIVIIGHSNTVPAYINLLLKEQKYKHLSEEQYDLMFIVTVPDNGSPAVVILNTSSIHSANK